MSALTNGKDLQGQPVYAAPLADTTNDWNQSVAIPASTIKTFTIPTDPIRARRALISSTVSYFVAANENPVLPTSTVTGQAGQLNLSCIDLTTTEMADKTDLRFISRSGGDINVSFYL
jgi:hypothetical protein